MPMQETAAIIGDGQMALVLADAIVHRGMRVRLWGPFEKHVQELASSRRSPRLRDFQLDSAVDITHDDAAIFDDATIIINAIPTQFIRSVWERLAPACPADLPLVCVSKGIENTTLLRPTQIFEQVLRQQHRLGSRSTCALSGPTIAAELARHLPATMVAASDDAALSARVQELFNVPWLRLYRNDDLLGVELAGATKNVIALAAGMIDGLQAGDNAKSALLARGLAEIARLGAAMGARLDTFFGIAGVGDLATTCFSPEGRNRTCGERLGKGESLDDILKQTTSVVEGVPTTRSVVELATRHDIDMPITQAVSRILFHGLSPRDAIEGLMSREMKTEKIG
jgi:glycerol-3-phosphate dehydrogenase (NAD(P)+)